MCNFLKFRHIWLSALVVGAFLVGAIPAAAAPAAAPVAQGGGGTNDSTCAVERVKSALPDVILLGETVDITLVSKIVCSSEQVPLHIVFVFDASGSMNEEGKIKSAKQAAQTVITNLDLQNNPLTMVGVVEFNTTATILCQLTNSSTQAKSCVGRVVAIGGTNITAGIQAGIRVLGNGRRNVQDVNLLREVMVVLSDGSDNNGCGGVLSASSQARATGAIVMTVCVGSGCDTQCMRAAASSARYYFAAANAGQLQAIFERIRQEIFNIVVKRLTVIDTLPANMQYVPDSADPQPDRIGPDGSELEWSPNAVPKDGITMTFKVKPLEVGYHPTNLSGTGEFIDNKGKKGAYAFEVPWVMVLQPFPLATPTVPPPTEPPPTRTPGPPPTPTNTPVPPTPTPTLTPTPTPTPTPKPRPIYLPIIVREKCDRIEIYADVALILDISTSMNRASVEGPSVRKLDEVLAAAKVFVGRMQFAPNQLGQHDQVAVVGFNDDAWIAQTLTSDKAAVLAAIDKLPKRQKEGTRLDLAFQKGAEALPANLRREGNTPTLILLTDGLPNRVPFQPGHSQEETVIAAAHVVKADGIRIYTIGVGRPDAPDLIDRVSPELLTVCASDPSMYYPAPDATQLSKIYTEIAYTFGCRDSFWSGR